MVNTISYSNKIMLSLLTYLHHVLVAFKLLIFDHKNTLVAMVLT